VFDLGDGSRPIIVDGEHRWRTAADPEIAAMTEGMVPIVRIKGDLSHRMMSTIRHNRARGEHAVLPMAEIVRKLLEAGQSQEDVQLLLQMEAEEVERLARRAGMPEYIGKAKKEFSKAWVPGDK
jgi:ParB-like chromosome segregation protein Spo0J